MGAGRVAQGGQVGEPPVGRLDGAHRDERGAGTDGLGDALQRDRADLEVAADVERVQHRGEVALRGEDLGTGGQGGGDIDPVCAATDAPRATRLAWTPASWA
ncbi:hypothetical protein SGLAM104S_00253 [Streptomyces glaucescens]